MAVVTRIGFILDMSGIDRDTTKLFFRRLVDFGVIRELGTPSVGKNLNDGSGQGRLSMANVTLGYTEESVTTKDSEREYYLLSQCSCEALRERTLRWQCQHTFVQELSRM